MELYQKDNKNVKIIEKFKELDEPNFLIKKRNSQVVFDLYSNFASKNKLQRLQECGTTLGFDLYKHPKKDEYNKKLASANFCKDKFCEMCNWRRARKYAIQNFKTLKAIQEENNVRYIFATFTIKNPEIKDLRETIKHFNKSWDRMVRTKKWKNSILGFVKAIEIPFQKSNKDYINLHAHCLLVVPTKYFNKNYNLYIKQNEFKKMWQKALRVDYTPSVDIRIIKPNPNRNEDDAIASVVAETTKYPMKALDFNGIDWQKFKILTEQTKGLRFVSFGGIVLEYRRKVLDEDDFNEDDLIGNESVNEEEINTWEYLGRLWYSLNCGKYELTHFEPSKFSCLYQTSQVSSK